MLSIHDTRALLSAVERLYAEMDVQQLPGAAVGVLASLLPSETVAFNLIRTDGRVEIVHNVEADRHNPTCVSIKANTRAWVLRSKPTRSCRVTVPEPTSISVNLNPRSVR